MYIYMMMEETDSAAISIFFVAENRLFDFLSPELPQTVKDELPGFISLTIITDNTCVARFERNAGRLRESTDRLTAYFQTSLSRRAYRAEVRMTLDYIREHAAEPLTWDAIGREFFISPGYFRQIFKQETGCTLKQCLLRARLEMAASLLQQTSLTSQEISDMVGFSEPNYFSRCFRRIYGMTPKELRAWYRVHEGASSAGLASPELVQRLEKHA